MTASLVRWTAGEPLDAIRQVMDISAPKLTVAEPVQDAETVSILKDLGVDLAQGYHFGAPVAREPAP